MIRLRSIVKLLKKWNSFKKQDCPDRKYFSLNHKYLIIHLERNTTESRSLFPVYKKQPQSKIDLPQNQR